MDPQCGQVNQYYNEIVDPKTNKVDPKKCKNYERI